MNKTDAIAKELSRVRQLKRNTESSIEFLRSEMEAGRIHIRVNPSIRFREELIKRIGFRKFVYVDPVTGEFSSEKKRFRFVPIWELLDSEDNIKDEIIIQI